MDPDIVSVDQEGSGFEHATSVERNGPFAAMILDQIPVEGGLVGAAALGMGAAERKLDGAADTFVE